MTYFPLHVTPTFCESWGLRTQYILLHKGPQWEEDASLVCKGPDWCGAPGRIACSEPKFSHPCHFHTILHIELWLSKNHSVISSLPFGCTFMKKTSSHRKVCCGCGLWGPYFLSYINSLTWSQGLDRPNKLEESKVFSLFTTFFLKTKTKPPPNIQEGLYVFNEPCMNATRVNFAKIYFHLFAQKPKRWTKAITKLIPCWLKYKLWIWAW